MTGKTANDDGAGTARPGRSGNGDKQAQIIAEACRLFAQRGFNGTSIRDIANAVRPAFRLLRSMLSKVAIFDPQCAGLPARGDTKPVYRTIGKQSLPQPWLSCQLWRLPTLKAVSSAMADASQMPHCTIAGDAQNAAWLQHPSPYWSSTRTVSAPRSSRRGCVRPAMTG
ncbi:TetR family transcriptional regulator [Mesorhizobium sp. ASY16-5R]|uniref:TetR family transcriptional regulator n=1 Tax=Mesorhizobium sp. ASY16-5R TaxID=3445772 RepID=UPI003F9FE0B7